MRTVRYRPHPGIRAVLLCAGLLPTIAARGAAQIPEKFTNLQVLPRDIDRAALVGIMRGFAGSLGVRCTYCHMVSDALDQPGDDFASDEKAPKRKARVMLRMVDRINEEILPQLPDRTSPNVEVTCRTCHGGIPRPVPIEAEVEGALAAGGIDAAVARYRELRDRYHGSRAYDFGFAPLNSLGERLLARDMASEAAVLVGLNAGYHPGSLPTLLLLGRARERAGDEEAAAEAYRALLAVDPATPFYDFYAGQARTRIEAIARDAG